MHDQQTWGVSLSVSYHFAFSYCSEIIVTQTDIICFKIDILLAPGLTFFSFLKKCSDFCYRKRFRSLAAASSLWPSPSVRSEHSTVWSARAPSCSGAELPAPQLHCTMRVNLTHFMHFLHVFKPINFPLNATVVVICQFSKWPFDLAVNIFWFFST